VGAVMTKRQVDDFLAPERLALDEVSRDNLTGAERKEAPVAPAGAGR